MLILFWDFIRGTFFWNIIIFWDVIKLDVFEICERLINFKIASKNLNMWNDYGNNDPIVSIIYMTNKENQYTTSKFHNVTV